MTNQRDQHRQAVNERNVQQVIEKRNPAEYQEGSEQPREASVQPRQQDQRGPYCHEQVIQRGRILVNVNKRKDRPERVRLNGPFAIGKVGPQIVVAWIAVSICSANEDEEGQ